MDILKYRSHKEEKMKSIKKNSMKAIQTTDYRLKEGSIFGYTLMKYVSPDYWDNIIKPANKEMVFENLTDYNYSRCFSYMFMEDIHLKSPFFTKEATQEVIKRGYIELISLKISIISPFYTIDRAMYQADGERLKINYIEEFKNEILEKKYQELKRVVEAEDYYLVDPDDLRIPLENVPIENVEPENVTYGRYLFE